MKEMIPIQNPTIAEKIRLMPLEVDSLKEYEARLLQKAYKIFGVMIGKENRDISSKAHFSYTLPDVAPATMTLYLLAPTPCKRHIRSFFEEMTENWLSEKEKIRILSSQEISFPGYYFLEILAYIRDEQQLSLIKANIDNFSNEIRRGITSNLTTNHILRLKHLSLEKKSSLVYAHAQILSDRFPKKFESDFFKALQNFLLNIRPAFQEKRSVLHLCRIIYSFYFFQKSLFQAIRAFPLRRHLNLRLFTSKIYYPFGFKEVLSVVISINILSEYERFTHRHILHALHRVFPFVECHKDSFYFHKDEQMHLLTFYMEIEKKEGLQFTLEEIKLLKKQLPQELKKSIEHLSHSLFIPRNEEELMRNIITLSHELKYVNDLPQAIISFQEQKGDLLRFNIILLRLLNKKTLPMQAMAHHLPSSMRFLFERVSHLGYVRKKHIKEANVFTLEVKNNLFFRENQSVDLVRAREFITLALEKMIGKFRDYNGGLLLKQNQRLEGIKKSLPEYGKQYEYLFENFFYSLSPPIIQASLPLEEGAMLFSLLLEALSTPFSTKESTLLMHRKSNHALAIVIKSSEAQLKEQVHRNVSLLQFGSLKFTKGSLDIEDNTYTSYLLLDNSYEKQEELLKIIHNTIEKWKEQQQGLESVQSLHLRLPRATKTLDPRIITDSTASALIKMLYEGLMSIGIEGKLQPAIAESVTISEDQKSYMFTLRESFWSNQAPLTAYDFAYAWKSIIDPAFSSPYSFLFFSIKNAEQAKRGKISLDEVGIYPLDDRHLFVQLEHPTPYFLQLTASSFFSPLWHEIDKKYPGWAYYSEKQYICNGPFKLDTWKMNNDLIVTKNPTYWEASSVKLDKIFINIIENEQTALEMFERKELDWLGDPLSKLPLAQLEKFIQKKELIIDDTAILFLFQLNLERQPFQSKKIRQAFFYAINRKKLIEQLPSSGHKALFRFYLDKESTPSLDDDNDALALRLFEEGLEELALTRRDISPIHLSHTEVDEHASICYIVGSMWKNLFNIEILYERILWTTHFEKVIQSDYMIAGLAWYKRYNDPSYAFNIFLQNSIEMIFTPWKNSQYLELMTKAKDALEPEEYLLEAEKILLEDMPVIPVLELKSRYVKNARLKNVPLSSTGIINFSKAYLSKKDPQEDL